MWEFMLSTVIILLIAVVTISFQILRALKVKPTEILKDEQAG